VTNKFPGPTILSTAGTVAVPNANAAIACAPPMRNIRCTPATTAAARTNGLTEPSRAGGTIMITSRTPATTAGMAVIKTEEG
jgi:hypothetical protein